MTSAPNCASRSSYAGLRVRLEHLDELLAVEAVAAPGLLLDVVELSDDRVERPSAVHSASRSHSSGNPVGGAADVALDGVVDHRADLLVQVGALEHRAPLAVDDLALPAHHVVVLEDVLAGLEVLRLDLRLRGGDRVRDPLVLDRDVVGDLERGEHPVDPVGLEQPHELVLQRQVEPGLARVALTAGAAAELVVDAPRLVALGAEDVEPADVADLVVLGRHLRLDPLDHGRPRGVVLLGVLDRVEPLLAQLLVGEEVDRAAEHDVGAATGHVGGDRDRALVAGQRDDLRLARRAAWR